MTYRTRTLIGAVLGLVLVAALGAYAYFGVHQKGKREHRDAVLGRLALDLRAGEVERIDMERRSQKVSLIRTPSAGQPLPAWRMIAPVEAEGDAVGINALLGILERMDAERRLADEDVPDRASFGLDPPRATWRLTMKDGRSLTLLVGKKSPFNNRLYLGLQGSGEVFLVKGQLEEELLSSAYDLRRKGLTSLEPTRVRRLTLKEADQEIVLERQEGVWHLVAPLTDRADGDGVSRLLNVLRNLRAKSFPPADIPASSYGLDEPMVQVVAESGPAAEVLEVWFGKGTLPSNRDRVYAEVKRPAPLRAEVASYQASAFMKKPFDLQAKAPVEFTRTDVARIKIVAAGELIVLEKNRPGQGDGGLANAVDGWALIAPVAAPAKQYKVDAILGALEKMRASRFVGLPKDLDLAAEGLDPPVRSVVLYSENGNEIQTLKIGKADRSGVRVLGSAREQVCLVDSKVMAALQAQVGDLRDDPARPTAAAPPAPKNP